MTHTELTEAAVRWLGGTMRCQPVLSGIASTAEIPDAIGWSSSWKNRGSILVECKTSTADFLRDKHGLLYFQKGKVRIITPAPERKEADKDSEIRLLRFALIHVHENLLRAGYAVQLRELTKFRGEGGISGEL